MLNIPFHILFYETWSLTCNRDLYWYFCQCADLVPTSNCTLVGGVREEGVLCTHIALGNLLPLTGILQGADTEVRDGDSGTGSQRDQHEESPQAAVQRQLQAVVLLQREGWNIHFTPGDISGDAESRDYSKAIKKNSRAPISHKLPQYQTSLSGHGLLIREACQSPQAQGTL